MNISLSPALKRYVETQVQSGRYLDESEVVRTALRWMETQAGASAGSVGPAAWANLSSAGEGDIMAMAFIVMMEAAKSAREDLKVIMDQVKAINAAKQAMRELLKQAKRDAAANQRFPPEAQRLDFSRGLGSERAYHRIKLPVLDADAPGGVRFTPCDLWPGKLTRAADLLAVVDNLKGQLDSLSEMGEMESLRLQMAMDRLSNLMSTLSNMLKKLSDTAQSITQNLK
jgi:hypothetical protein